MLSAFGAIPDEGRVVVDGPVVTGGGVTAGIDFALRIAAELHGEAVAQAAQLQIEYAPDPPFAAGRPETAPEAVLAAARERAAPMLAERRPRWTGPRRPWRRSPRERRDPPARSVRPGRLGAALGGLSPRSTAPPSRPRRRTSTWSRFHDPAEPMHALGAFAGEALVGIVHYLFHRSTWTPGPYCYLQDLFTAEAARGQGAGRALIEAVYERARGGGREPHLLADAGGQRDRARALRHPRRPAGLHPVPQDVLSAPRRGRRRPLSPPGRERARGIGYSSGVTESARASFRRPPRPGRRPFGLRPRLGGAARRRLRAARGRHRPDARRAGHRGPRAGRPGRVVQPAPGFLAPRLRDLMPDPDDARRHDGGGDAAGRGRVAPRAGRDLRRLRRRRRLRGRAPGRVPRGLRPARHDPHPRPDHRGLRPERRRRCARFASEGARLIVTVDCGTAGHEPLAEAARLGLDVVVLDHHGAPETPADRAAPS